MTRVRADVGEVAEHAAAALAAVRPVSARIGDQVLAMAGMLPWARGQLAESARQLRAGLSVPGVTLPGMTTPDDSAVSADDWTRGYQPDFPVMQVPDRGVRGPRERSSRVTGFGAGAHGARRRPREDRVATRDRSGNYVPPESEDSFQRWVIETAHLYGWLVHHARPAWVGDEDDDDEGGRGRRRRRYVTPIQGDAGAPDLLLCKAGHTPILAELKRDDTYLKPNQKPWRAAIPAEQYRLWRPRDRAAIVAELSR